MDNELIESVNYTSVRKLIILSFLFFIVPFLGFLFLKTQYDTNVLYKLEGLHTVLILAMSTLSLIVAVIGYTTYASSTDIRVMFIVFAFFAFGAIFMLHALSLPSLAMASQEFFMVTEHYSLFFVSLLVIIGASLPEITPTSATYGSRWYVFIATQIFIFLFFVIAISLQPVSVVLDKLIYLPVILTCILFLGAVVKLLRRYAVDHNKFILYIILGISVLLNATIIPFFDKEWDAMWWYFHFILALSFAVASFGMITMWIQEIKKKRI